MIKVISGLCTIVRDISITNHTMMKPFIPVNDDKHCRVASDE